MPGQIGVYCLARLQPRAPAVDRRLDMTYQTIEVEPVTLRTGGIVHGVDLGKP